MQDHTLTFTNAFSTGAVGSAGSNDAVDEGRHIDASGITPASIAYNRMKNTMGSWVAKQKVGKDILDLGAPHSGTIFPV